MSVVTHCSGYLVHSKGSTVGEAKQAEKPSVRHADVMHVKIPAEHRTPLFRRYSGA